MATRAITRALVAGLLAVTATLSACGSGAGTDNVDAAGSDGPSLTTSSTTSPTAVSSPSATTSPPLLTVSPRPAHPTNGLFAYLDDPKHPHADVPRMDVFTKRPDGTGVRRLTHTRDVEDLAWSPNGDWIAYLRGADQLWVMHANGTDQHLLTSDGGYQPAWSPDGTRIAYNSADSIAVLDLRTGQTRGFGAPPGVSSASGARWSPDSKQIAFTGAADESDPEYDSDAYTIPTAIYVMDAATGREFRRLPGTRELLGFDWSWATGQIVYSSGSDTRDAYCTGDLFVIDSSGARPRTLVAMPCRENMPAWSPDGRSVLFWSMGPKRGDVDRRADFGLWIANADGSDARLLFHDGGGIWQPRG